MDSIPEEILNTLKCNLCGEYLSYPPITLYAETGSVCGRCPKLDAENNIEPLHEKNYESLAKLFKFPCRYAFDGCRLMIQMDKMPEHEQECTYKPYFCPILPLGTCPWQGILTELHEHFGSNHSSSMLNSKIFEVDFINNYKENLLLSEHDELFLVRTDFEKVSNELRIFISLLGSADKAKNFTYQLVFNTINDMFTSKYPIMPVIANSEFADSVSVVNLDHLNKALQEPSSITCKVNILFNDKEVTTIVDSLKFVSNTSKLLVDLECPVCQEFMVPPIYQCTVGHSVCADCKTNLLICPTCRCAMGEIRNFTLEKLTENIEYDCKNRGEGCKFVSNSLKIKNHEKECCFNPLKCPLHSTFNCKWSGSLKEISEHMTYTHMDIVQSDIYIMTIQSGVNNKKYTIMSMYSEWFVIEYHYKHDEGEFSICASLIGYEDQAAKFMYEVSLYNDPNKTGVELMSRKYCGFSTKNVEDFKNVTIWCNEMLEPFILVNEEQLRIKCKIIKI